MSICTRFLSLFFRFCVVCFLNNFIAFAVVLSTVQCAVCMCAHTVSHWNFVVVVVTVLLWLVWFTLVLIVAHNRKGKHTIRVYDSVSILKASTHFRFIYSNNMHFSLSLLLFIFGLVWFFSSLFIILFQYYSLEFLKINL